MMRSDDFMAIQPKLEPEASAGDDETFALISIAVSLKRIADALSGGDGKPGLADSVMVAIEQGIRSARQ